ncbi:hypothetical protein VP01_390g5 [Puccinia sorghi]|uniref:Uncharacterized protein n=1 Tax=Puccinia sorghi TaxID=27349 RepID=A0A0L6USM4_9BASI|nr:hypothetical protein VP01_390g5 [Puccinia sorghi]
MSISPRTSSNKAYQQGHHPQAKNIQSQINSQVTVIRRKKKRNHIWTNDPLLQLIIDQISLGKGTENGNLKAEGWNQAHQNKIFGRLCVTFLGTIWHIPCLLGPITTPKREAMCADCHAVTSV